MNKAEMADRLASRTGLNKVGARDAVDSMFAVIGEALAVVRRAISTPIGMPTY